MTLCNLIPIVQVSIEFFGKSRGAAILVTSNTTRNENIRTIDKKKKKTLHDAASSS